MNKKNPTYEQLWEENKQLKKQLASLRESDHQIEETQDKYRVILNSIGDAVITIDINGLIRFMNPVAEQLTGWSEMNAEHQKLTEVFWIINNQTLKPVQNPVNRVLESGNTEWLAKNTILVSSDGTECQVADSASPIRNKEGTITGVVLVFRDVTENFRLNKELQSSKEQLASLNEKLIERNEILEARNDQLEIYKMMVEGSFDMMAVLDYNYYYLCVNQAYLTFYQLNREDVIGHQANEIIDQKSFEEKVKPNLDKCLRGEAVQYEMIRDALKGGKCYLDIIYYPLQKDNTINGVIAVLRDITAHKQSEKELRKSRDKFHALIEQSSEMLFLHDLSGQIVEINRMAEINTGYNREELYNMNVFDLDPDAADRDDIHKYWKALSVNDSPVSFESRHKKKEGTFYPVEVVMSKIELDNHHYILALARDITERKRSEEQLVKAKQQAEEGDRLKSAFLANMSHEIRTPMNGIMGFAQLLQEKEYDQAEQQKFLDIIHSRSGQLLQIINDIVDVSKIEANQLQLNFQETCLHDLMQNLYQIYVNTLKSKGKEHIALKIHENLNDQDSCIYTDPNRFTQVMDNLLSNAIKFTHEGSITIGYEWFSENTLLFYVRDTGIGIPSDQKPYIFERFRQLDSPTNEGTGLGLSISEKLVELMGGKMWVNSTEGEGSVFYFTLPYRTVTADKNRSPADPKQQQQKNSREGKTLLVIEDDPSSRDYIKEAVEPEGFTLIIGETGEEGYQKFKENPDIDLILLDFKLPDYNGLEILRKIRSGSVNKDVPVIAQTAYAMREDMQKSKEAGCDDYISKPFDILQLMKKIHSLLYQD